MKAEWRRECLFFKQLFDAEHERTGLTQKELAIMVGKSPQLISHIYNQRARVTLDTARDIAAVFGVPLAEILPWTARLSSQEQIEKYGEDLEALNDLSSENREKMLKMMRRLARSQEVA